MFLNEAEQFEYLLPVTGLEVKSCVPLSSILT